MVKKIGTRLFGGKKYTYMLSLNDKILLKQTVDHFRKEMYVRVTESNRKPYPLYDIWVRRK